MNASDRRNPSSAMEWLVTALLIAAFAIALWAVMQRSAAPPVVAGAPLPDTGTLAGWINVGDGEAPDLQGKIIVVDCWASWCGPCRHEMPNLVGVARKYRPLGVQFIGVTQETALDLPAIQQFIDATPGFDWPVAYGGYDFLAELQVPGFPTLMVFGADGVSRWSHVGVGGAGRLDEALDEALAAVR